MKAIFIVLLTALLMGCQSQPDSAQETVSYTSDSWKTLIPESCMQFTDGCNQCQRGPNGVTACTRKFCADYGMPQCLQPGVDVSDYRVIYHCDGDKSFSLSYGVYHRGEQDIQLSPDEVMMADHQSLSSTLLTRANHPTGSLYQGDKTAVYLLGSTGRVEMDGLTIYGNCEVVGS